MRHVHQVTLASCGIAIAVLVLGILAPPSRAADDTALRLANVDGANTAYVRVPNSAAFSLQTFTLEAWVERVGAGYGFSTDPSGAAIISKPIEGASGSNIASWHLHWTPNGEIHFDLVHTPYSSGVYLMSAAVATPLARHHLAVTFDGSTIREYIDGVLMGSAPWSLGTVYYGANDVLLGADNFSFGYFRRFDGYIDDVRIWDFARTESEINQTMNCHLAGPWKGLVAYWPFDASNLTDATGNGHGGAVDGVAGSATYASLASLGDCTLGVGDTPGGPGSTVAMSIFPMPARERITVSFDLPRPSVATLEVVDVAGRRLAVLASREFGAGRQQVAGDLAALGLSASRPGMLFARLRWDGGAVSRPLVITR